MSGNSIQIYSVYVYMSAREQEDKKGKKDNNEIKIKLFLFRKISQNVHWKALPKNLLLWPKVFVCKECIM